MSCEHNAAIIHRADAVSRFLATCPDCTSVASVGFHEVMTPILGWDGFVQVVKARLSQNDVTRATETPEQEPAGAVDTGDRSHVSNCVCGRCVGERRRVRGLGPLPN